MPTASCTDRRRPLADGTSVPDMESLSDVVSVPSRMDPKPCRNRNRPVLFVGALTQNQASGSFDDDVQEVASPDSAPFSSPKHTCRSALTLPGLRTRCRTMTNVFAVTGESGQRMAEPNSTDRESWTVIHTPASASQMWMSQHLSFQRKPIDFGCGTHGQTLVWDIAYAESKTAQLD